MFHPNDPAEAQPAQSIQPVFPAATPESAPQQPQRPVFSRGPFLLQPRNAKFLRGEAKFSALPDRSIFVILLFLLVFGLCFGGTLLSEMYVNSVIDKEGVAT